MGYFPPNMYDPQINMIRKPFELNKERLRKDFMSPKYENRRKEFFATYSEYLRNYVRDEYYEFMNDIQTEVNFFEWFDHYFKQKILAGRNTNTSFTNKSSLLQREVTNKPLNTSTRGSLDRASLDIHTHAITPPNTLNTSHTPNTPNTIIKSTNHMDKSIKYACKISNSPFTKTHPRELSDKNLAKNQTILTSQYSQINIIKKNKKDNINKDKKDKKKPKIDKLDSKEKVTNHKPICYKMQ